MGKRIQILWGELWAGPVVALMVLKINASSLLATFIETSKMAKRNQEQKTIAFGQKTGL